MIVLSLTLVDRRGCCIFCLICGTVKTCFFFPTFSDSLFAENHSLTLINSSLTVLNNMFKLLCSKKKLISSVNIIGTSTFEELGRSFTYNKNSNGPSIEACGTPQLISFFSVSADSVIFIYCFYIFFGRAKMCAHNQITRPIKAQLETLLFSLYYLNSTYNLDL